MNDETYYENITQLTEVLLGEALFNDDWTWMGLAEYLKRYYTKGDLEDLIFFLEEA